MLQLLATRGATPPFPSTSVQVPETRQVPLAGPLLPPRTVIFLEGLARAPQYRVIEGCVATVQTLSDGRRQIIDLVGPGRLIGLGFGDQNRYSAETLGFTRLEAMSGSMAEGARPQAGRRDLSSLSDTRRSRRLAWPHPGNSQPLRLPPEKGGPHRHQAWRSRDRP